MRCRRARIDQVTDGLRLQQVELPVQHRSAGELPWLRLAYARSDERREHHGGDE
jgi:hypothetical protein